MRLEGSRSLWTKKKSENGIYFYMALLKKFLKSILIGVTISIGIDVLCPPCKRRVSLSPRRVWIGELILKFYVSIAQEKIPPDAVIYMRRTGAYGAENYALMDTFKKWIKANNLYDEDTVIYAMALDNPETEEPCRCRYDVCINRPQNQNDASDQVECRELEGGKYLVFLIPHTIDAVRTAWQMCFSELELLGYLPDESRPIMERYKKRLVDQQYCELCMPVL
mgnify:FL=1